MMAWELAAVFRALAEDTDQGAGNIAAAMARFTGTTADTEDGNVARTLAADAETARAIAAIGREPDMLADSTPAGTGWADAGRTPAAAGWAGAGHVEASSPEAEAAYAAIRGNAGDVSKIAENTGISPDIIVQVKTHLFLTEHDIPIGPNNVAHGYFTADEEIAGLWGKAEDGTLNPAQQSRLRSLISHEYVESRLMESGMSYRSAAPEAWNGDEQTFNPRYFGAHEVAPIAANGSLRQWPTLGLTPPAAPIAPDLSNLEDVVNAARKGLKL
jgi:hypothetical protein